MLACRTHKKQLRYHLQALPSFSIEDFRAGEVEENSKFVEGERREDSKTVDYNRIRGRARRRIQLEQ